MSMPTFPENATDITQEQAFNMILGSIAMEELALSHIMNGEAEKLQYILGTLPGKRGGICVTTRELLEVNRSITELLENVMHNQLLLKGKLTKVLDAKYCFQSCCFPEEDSCIPNCHTSCSRTHTSCVYRAAKCCLSGGCCFTWRSSEEGSPVGWSGCSSATIHPSCPCPHLVGYSFLLCVPQAGKVQISMETSQCGESRELSDIVGHTEQPCARLRITGTTVLPAEQCRPPLPFRFRLVSPAAVEVEQATLTLTVL